MTSSRLYVYLQRPDTGEWVTVGRYSRATPDGPGIFLYAPRYVESGLCWTIDPVNLPLIPGHAFTAPRYRGLHDVLRDASPDAWGKMLLQRAHQLAPDTHDARYLFLAGNADRWGALAVGTEKRPSIARMAHPRLPQLEVLSEELLAIAERRAPVDAKLRKRLLGTPSLGGARPKATVRDGQEFWLVKPFLATDTADVPLLEHVSHEWGNRCGLRFAKTVLHRLSDGRSVVRVLRFDRQGERRHMAVSGASLLQTEFPGGAITEASRWSYPRLAEELRRIGAPDEDRRELFGRMVFNAAIGNDDDHPRNHAVIYQAEEQRWRLSPAFDVVPNPDETPKQLALQVSLGTHLIARETILADAVRFAFRNREQAADYMDGLLKRMRASFAAVEPMLPASLSKTLDARLSAIGTLLS